MVAVRPTAPATPLRTTSPGQVAACAIASGPAMTSGIGWPAVWSALAAAAASADRTSAWALGRATATRGAPNSMACWASRAGLPPPAASPATRNRSGLRRITSRAWVPIDPVEPRMTTARGSTDPLCP